MLESMSNIGKVKENDENNQGIVNASVSYRKKSSLNNYYTAYLHMYRLYSDYLTIIL